MFVQMLKLDLDWHYMSDSPSPIRAGSLNLNTQPARENHQIIEGVIFAGNMLPRRVLMLWQGKFTSLSMQLVAVLVFLGQTPTLVVVLAAFAYVFGLMEGVVSLSRMIFK
jgi:hypothetical protein